MPVRALAEKHHALPDYFLKALKVHQSFRPPKRLMNFEKINR